MIEDNKNFEHVIGALYYLDMMISAMDTQYTTADIKWIGIIKHLFDFVISEKKQDIMKYDNYIHSTFECFIKQIRRLRLSLRDLSYCDADFANLIMGQIEMIDAAQDIETIKSMVNGTDNANLPKKEVLKIFENVEEFELYLDFHGDLYVISLSSLLSIIRLHPSIRMVKVVLGYPKYISKIQSVYSLSMEIKTKYRNAGFNIYLKQEQQEYKKIWIYCMIEREV